MPRITTCPEDIVDIPKNVSVSQKGYVYYNTDTFWRDSKSLSHKYADHKKVCIGKSLNPNCRWTDDPRMYPNQNYYKLFDIDKLPVAPERSDSISVGVLSAVAQIATDKHNLIGALTEVFGEEDTRLILDLAMYMLTQESAVFQHFPHWARNHALFSESIRSDSYISIFERENVTISKINLFKKLWAKRVIDDGRLYLCYDSTNVNSQAEGVFLVEKGHAKDDPSLRQVNTDYVVRQSDGLPVTFTVFPGSITDMSEASEMIAFFRELLGPEEWDEKGKDLSIISDRGYISEENVADFDRSGIGFLLMLRRNMGITDTLITMYADTVRSSANYIPERDQYAKTFISHLFKDDDTERYFHVIWDPVLETRHRKKLYNDIDSAEKKLNKIVERKTCLSEEEACRYKKLFSLNLEEDGTINVKKRGRGKGEKEVASYRVVSFTRNTYSIDQELKKCGFYVLVSSWEMTAVEAVEAYAKRDCVEKVFMALKSFLGMDKIGMQTDEGIHTKSLIWFIAAILHSEIFICTKELRASDRKTYTVPSVIDQLEEISSDRNLPSSQYERRYKPNKKQNNILKALGISIEEIDERIAQL